MAETLAINPAMSTLDIKRLRSRRARRRMSVDLARGRWGRVLLDAKKTQHLFRATRRGDQGIAERLSTLLLKVNVVGPAMKRHADILMGNPPRVTLPDGFGAQAAAVASLQSASLWETLCLEVASRVYREISAAVKIDLDPMTGAPVLCLLDNERWFPSARVRADGQPDAWEGRWIIEKPDPADPRRTKAYLRVERHRVVRDMPVGQGGSTALYSGGIIEQEAYECKGAGGADVLVELGELTRVPLARAIAAGSSVPQELTLTGIASPMIVEFVIARDAGEPEGLISEDDLDVPDMVAASVSRLARLHERHVEPKRRVPQSMVDKSTGNVVDSEYIVEDGDKEFEFISAEANFDAALGLVERMVSWHATLMEMAAPLLGIHPKDGGTPDTADKLRIYSTTTIAAASRAEKYFRPALARLMDISSEFIARLPLPVGGFSTAPVQVTMRPELPKDAVERAREQAELRREGLTSLNAALVEIHGEQRAPQILEEIEAEENTKTEREQRSLGFAVGVGAGAGAGPGGGDRGTGNGGDAPVVEAA